MRRRGCSFCGTVLRSSMFPRPRYHAQERRALERGNEIRAIAGAIARLLDAGNTRSEWRTTPPRTFRGTPYTRKWTPRFYGSQTCEMAWPRHPPRARLEDPRSRVLPRRGPPVAVIRVPRWCQHDQWEKRQPRGKHPRGTPRGGPERSTDDPRRNPLGGLCGGPARSAKEPQTPPHTSRVRTNGETRW